ncbi:MAG: hypothetical protein R3F17_03125 [Planctomycetota bacterium]
MRAHETNKSWWRLAFGMAAHRYFLHVDPVLEKELGADREGRVAAFLAQARDEGPELCAGAELRARYEVEASALGSLAPLGAAMTMGVEIAEDVPAHWRLLGVAGVPREKANLRAVLAQECVANVMLALLYAESREAGQVASMETLANELWHGQSQLFADLRMIAPLWLPSATRADHSEAQEQARQRCSDPDLMMDCLPAADFARTVAAAPQIAELYRSGLGVGQA